MPRIILLILVLLVAVYLVSRFRRLSPDRQKQLIKALIITGLVALLGVLALTGRLNWIIAAIGALLPLLPRAGKLLFSLWPALLPYFRRYKQNKQANMQAQFVKLQIDMLTGEIQGVVLQGKFKGNQLQQMSLEQIKALLEECAQQDKESAALVTAYLDRKYADWSPGSGAGSSAASDMPDTDMNEQQARDILGVSKKADKEEIIKAHKVLMQKLHPDRGGSDYLAKQINRARDALLKSL